MSAVELGGKNLPAGQMVEAAMQPMLEIEQREKLLQQNQPA